MVTGEFTGFFAKEARFTQIIRSPACGYPSFALQNVAEFSRAGLPRQKIKPRKFSPAN